MDINGLNFTRTRIAPTPSGYLHLGNILSFVITIAMARKSGAAVLLRIDDMDQDRVQDAYLHDIFDTLNFLELPWDEGPTDIHEFKNQFSQTHRLPKYQAAMEQLASAGKVFACKCSRSQLQQNPVYPGTCIPLNYPLDEQGTNWRFHTQPAQEVQIRNIDGTITTTTVPDQMQYFVVRKKDGNPAYQLSSVIDDIYFGVDLIVRGNDLWPSTVAQLCLANDHFAQTSFFHHPLVTDSEGKKLSKSAGATSIHFLRKQGLQKEDIYKLLGNEDTIDWQTLAASLEYL